MKTRMINIDEIQFDEKFYPRTQEDWTTVTKYKDAMLAGSIFPPICVAILGKQKILVDGKHRLSALKANKIKTFQAEILTGLTPNQIYVEAVRRNVSHGLDLSFYERMVIAQRLRAMDLAPKEIGAILRIPSGKLEQYVASRMAISSTGEEVVLKAPLKHLAGTTIDVSAAEQAVFNAESQVQLLEQVLVLFRNNWFDKKNDAIKDKLRELRGFLR